MSRTLGAALVAVLVLAATPTAARTFSIDDLLAQEQVGAAALDPQGRWAVFERQGPYDQGTRFDLGQNNVLASSRLMIAATGAAGAARPWLHPDAGPGQVFGGFSPSGAHAAVFQLAGGRWRLGVAATSTGAVRWLEISPEALWFGRSIAWLSERELLVLTNDDAALPTRLREPSQSASLLPGVWAKAVAGQPSMTAVGSGRYSAVRARPIRRLLAIDTASGATRTIAEGEITDFEPAPGGRTVAILEAGEDLQAWPGRSLHGDWGLADQAQRLTLVDLGSGRRTLPCPACDVLDSLLAWSPDGASLLIYARGPSAPWRTGGFWRIDAGGRAQQLTAPPFAPAMTYRPERVQAGWLGRDPVVLGRGAGGATGWYRLSAAGPVRLGRRLADPGLLLASDPDGLTVLSGQRLWRLDRRGGAERLGPDQTVRAVRAAAGRDGRLARAASSEGWAIAADGEARERLLRLTGSRAIEVAALPPGATVMAAGGAGALTRCDAPSGLETVGFSRASGEAWPLSTLNERFADVDALDARPVEHRGPDGRPLRSWLFLPRRTAQTPPPPLVVKVYSGDVYRDWPRPKPPVLGFVTDIRVLVGHGYAVLTPSLPVPDRAPQEPAAGLGERVLTVVDAAARAPELQGLFDPTRLAIVGQSYGGYTVGAVLTQTDRFRAAVAQSGYFDLISEWAGLSVTVRPRPEPGLRSNGATGGMESAQGRMGVPPWTDPARYARNSPFLLADRITTPLLLFHGDQDGNVSISQSEALFSALYRQDKDAMLVTYWGEGHNIASPGNVRDLYTRMFAFLDARLSAATAPDPAHPEPAPASGAPTLRWPRP